LRVACNIRPRVARPRMCASTDTQTPNCGFYWNLFTDWGIVDLGFGGWIRLLVQVFQEPPSILDNPSHGALLD
jgi:hypothetical protein